MITCLRLRPRSPPSLLYIELLLGRARALQEGLQMLGEDLVRIWYSGFFSGSRRQYECAWVWGQVPGMLLSGQQHAVQVRARLASGASMLLRATKSSSCSSGSAIGVSSYQTRLLTRECIPPTRWPFKQSSSPRCLQTLGLRTPPLLYSESGFGWASCSSPPVGPFRSTCRNGTRGHTAGGAEPDISGIGDIEYRDNRVIRGGSFGDDPLILRTFDRRSTADNVGSNYYPNFGQKTGFRCAGDVN